MKLKKFYNSLKLTLISRIFQSDGKWTCFPIISKATDLTIFGIDKALLLTHSLTDLFLKDLGKTTIE